MITVADTNALNAYLGPVPGLVPERGTDAVAPLEALRPVHEGPFGGGLGGHTPEQAAAFTRRRASAPPAAPRPAVLPAQGPAWAPPALALTRPQTAAAVLARRASEPMSGPTRAPGHRAPGNAGALRRELRGLGPEAEGLGEQRVLAILG